MAMDKELIFGTSNQAKIRQVQDALETTGIRVVGINEFDINLDIDEDAETAQDNAKKKAVAYATALGRTVFSMDNALYFKGLPSDKQPGLHVRRVDGLERSTDDEMISSYVKLIETHGGSLEGWWEYGVSIAQPSGDSAEDSFVSPRLFVSKPSETVEPGYPLDSIQIDPDTGKYISEMDPDEKSRFWQRKIGRPLAKFIKENL